MELTLAPCTAVSAWKLFAISAAIASMDPLHTLGRFLIAVLSMSKRVSYEVIPSWVTLSTEASEMNFMLVEALSQERNVALVVTMLNNQINSL